MSSFINLLDVVYPVGSYYITESSTSPATLFGGTWSKVTNRYLKGGTSAGTTGGQNTIALSLLNLPGVIWATDGLSSDTIKVSFNNAGSTGYGANAAPKRTATAFSNEPAYRTVYMWYRTV